MSKAMYRAVSVPAGMASGILVGKAFQKTWKLAANEDEAPKPTDASRRWHVILIAAAMQGATVAAVRAAVNRLAAAGTHELTGVNEDNGGTHKKNSGGTREKQGKKA